MNEDICPQQRIKIIVLSEEDGEMSLEFSSVTACLVAKYDRIVSSAEVVDCLCFTLCERPV